MKINGAKNNIFVFFLIAAGLFQGTVFSFGRVYEPSSSYSGFRKSKNLNFEFKNKSKENIDISIMPALSGEVHGSGTSETDVSLDDPPTEFSLKSKKKAQGEATVFYSQKEITISIIPEKGTKKSYKVYMKSGGKTAYLKWDGKNLLPQKGIFGRTLSGWNLKKNVKEDDIKPVKKTVKKKRSSGTSLEDLSESEGSTTFNSDVYAIRGRRRSMEDADTILDTFASNYTYFGVFDGHGGAGVSKEVSEKLHDILGEKLKNKYKVKKAFKQAFKEMDKNLKEKGGKLYDGMGSTAVVALVDKNKKYFYGANLGDSRAVLSSKGKAKAITSDHKASSKTEQKLVEQRGGKVVKGWRGGPPRVQGQLAVTRAFGDFSLKAYVSNEPEVFKHIITTNTEFLILACDGVWDVISNKEAVDIVKKALDNNNNAKAAAKALVTKAYNKNSYDNITALIVVFSR